jgi:CubicO group peptidase (beta-lactamase class C family)
VPSGGAVGTARAIARAYSVFATGGRELGLRQETLDLLTAPAFQLGSARSFGAPGAGGSLGFADPTTGVGYAYVTNRMGTSLTGDPRDIALRDALYRSISVLSGQVGRELPRLFATESDSRSTKSSLSLHHICKIWDRR